MKCWWVFNHKWDNWHWIARPEPKASFMGEIPWVAGFWTFCLKCNKKKYNVDLVPKEVAKAGPRAYLGL